MSFWKKQTGVGMRLLPLVMPPSPPTKLAPLGWPVDEEDEQAAAMSASAVAPASAVALRRTRRTANRSARGELM